MLTIDYVQTLLCLHLPDGAWPVVGVRAPGHIGVSVAARVSWMTLDHALRMVQEAIPCCIALTYAHAPGLATTLPPRGI